MAQSASLPFSEPAWLGGLESPYYNESHRNLQSYVRKYIDDNIMPHALEWEAKGDCPDDAKDSYLNSGIALADVPTQYRPAHLRSLAGIPTDELDAFHNLILMDESFRFEGGIGIALAGANLIGVPPVLNHGTEAQKRRWVPGVFTRETQFCLGITEPTGGSDVGNIRTRAVRSADGAFFTVNGTKKWITGAQWATHMTTAVRTGGPGLGGISLLVIPLSSPGVEIEKIENSGHNAGGASWVRLSDVRVPAENILGEENAGFKYSMSLLSHPLPLYLITVPALLTAYPSVMHNFNKERFVMAVGCNRKARTCLSTALEYALNRETFNQPLISHQIIRHKIMTLGREVEAHWAWLEQIAYHVQIHGWHTDTAAARIALAKVSGGRILELAAREAQQVMGGVAYQRNGPGGGGKVEQITRDLRMMVVGGGSEEILEDLAFRQEVKAARKKGARI